MFKPFSEETIQDILLTHPELTKEYIVSKHREIYDSVSDEEVEEFLGKLIKSEEENDEEWYVEWDFEKAKNLLISSREADAHLTMDWELVKKKLYGRIKNVHKSE